MLAKDIMTKDVIYVSPFITAREALRIMSDNGIGGLPVLDEKGSLVGIITESDVIQRKTLFDKLDHWIRLESFLRRKKDLEEDHYLEDLNDYLDYTVEEIMTTRVKTVTPETDLDRVAMLMVKNKINRLPVLDNKKLVGIIARCDVINAISS